MTVTTSIRRTVLGSLHHVRPQRRAGLPRAASQTVLVLFAALALSALVPSPAYAALTVTHLTWDTVGLDSNNVNVGPNQFPVGARVCTDVAATNVQANFVWDSANTYVNLRPGTASSLPVPPATTNLTAGACTDFYFEVEITRNAAAYDTSRSYHIAITADGGATTASTPTPREVFVEHIISQSRNGIQDLQLSTDGGSTFSSVAAGGTMTLVVGSTYDIRLVGSTATNGYEQIETFVNFPNIIFQVLSVVTTYTANTSTHVDTTSLYGDGCLWEDNPLSPNYRSCLDTGKAGGNVTVTYRVKILSLPVSPLVNPEPLNSLIHDFSGSSYHYNTDYGVNTRYTNIVDPTTSLAFAKSFNPSSTSVNGVSTLTFTITNQTTGSVSGVNFTDPLPSTPGQLVVANPANAVTSGCGTPTFAPSPGATSLSFSNGTLGPSGTCTVRVSVTAPAAGTYTNTSNHLFIGAVDTGLTASAQLTVSTGPALATCSGAGTGATMELARWTMEPGAAAPPSPSFLSSNVSTTATDYQGTGTSTISSTYGNPVNAWSVADGWQKSSTTPVLYPQPNAPYFEFGLDTSKFTGVSIGFDYKIEGNWSNAGDNNIYVYSSANTGSFSTLSTITGFSKNSPWITQAAITAATTGTSTTRFRMNAVGAQGTGTAQELIFDNVIVSGCGYPYPRISKAFAPNPIAVGSTSALTFTLANQNSVTLTGVAFTDTLPTGVLVSSGAQSNTCGGTLTATVGSATISLSGGTIAARSNTPPFADATCAITVPVTASTAGPHDNVSGYVSSSASGPNTGPNGTARATLIAVRPPIISKEFSPETILQNGTSTLTFTIQNPNPSDAQGGIAFADIYPSNLANTNPAVTTNTCGGTVNAPNGGPLVSLTGGSLAGGATCKVTVNVTSGTAGTYLNTSQNVSYIINGVTVNGNTATDTLYVRAAAPSLSLQKEVATSSSGPWGTALVIPGGNNVYYRFTVENTGDVALTSINVTDPTVSTSSCTWPATLPVAVPANENHIATCVVGPLTAQLGYIPNTAQAHGTYSSTVYNSNNDSASYENDNFGHLPSAYANMNLFNDGGARHLNCNKYLGASVTTTDLDGINTATYTYKITDDGVTWTPNVNWTTTTGGSMDVTVTCPGGGCYLNGWVDWNADNDFDDTGEQIFTSLPVTAGLNTLTFSIPSGALLDGTVLYSRFRLYNAQPAAASRPNGAALGTDGTTRLCGEIEDPFFVVNNGVVNPVTVASFSTRREGGNGVSFAWTTASESGNVGFVLFVQAGDKLVPVNDELIPSRLVDSLERQSYTYRAEVEGDTFYIEEVSITSQLRLHGPFRLGQTYGGVLQDERVDWPAIQREHEARRAADRDAILNHRGMSDDGTTVLLQVRSNGIHRVTRDMLQAAGVPLPASLGHVPLSLLNHGQPVPMYWPIDGLGTEFEFYGEAADTLYTDTNVYVLQIGTSSTVAIPVVDGTPDVVPNLPPAYTTTFVLNRQRAYSSYAPSGDPWYDTSMLAYTTSKSWNIPFQLDGVADPSAPSTLELVAWGVTDWPESPDHHLVASINGVPVVNQTFDGLVEKTWRVQLPAGTLHNGANTLRLTLPGDTGVPWDLVNFDRLAITYQRLFQAQNGRLTFTARGADFRVTNLPNSGVIVYRLDPRQGPQRLRGVLVQPDGATFAATFSGLPDTATYVVTTAAALYAPGIDITRPRSDLRRRAEYLVITHPDFIEGIQPLVDARESSGLSVNVVDVDDIYAAYSFGLFDPKAIKDYIAYAAENLGTRSVLLVGGDTYDYRNYLGGNSISFIPSLYAATDPYATYVPADPLYTDLDGDGLPDLAIGRFPVRTAADLDSMVAKTLAYQDKGYGKTSLFAADLADAGVSFKDLNAGFISQLPPGWSVETVNLDDLDVPTARALLLDAMNRGTALVTFTGHSGPREWTFSDLFTADDAQALTNAGLPFVVAQWGCWNTYFVDPVNDYLVQAFLFSGDRGAAAVLGGTTLTDSRSERRLGELLTPRLVTPGMSIGQALQDAKSELAATHPELLDVLLGWTLMGDPELVLEPSTLGQK